MEIKAIDQAAVHKICSGQVVLTLAVAVKELVENAIDAGATTVEVRLRDHGGKLIEVIDNGCGVEEKNFAGLTLKHHTSKIGKFEDLDCGVTTFGFRGEALSSLCALSNLSVTTRHKTSKVATRLQYDHHGKISERKACARQVGTTVTLEDLFTTLPVRHKEFTRNLKREFHKMILLLNAYCIISTGVKVTCTNQTGPAGKRSAVVATNGSAMKENITSVFGSKQVGTLKEFVLEEPKDEHKEHFSCRVTSDHHPFTVTGYVSSCQHGSGRGSIDRQYYFINGRPCEIEKVSRLVNEIYHTYNKHQYPCVFLNIQTDKGAVDVNVTPDKRKIFVDYESYLLAAFKTSLMRLWEPESSVYTHHNIPQTSLSNTEHASSQNSDGRGSMKRTLSDLYKRVKEEQTAKKRSSLDGFVYRLPREDFSSASSTSETTGTTQTDSPSHSSQHSQISGISRLSTELSAQSQLSSELAIQSQHSLQDSSHDEAEFLGNCLSVERIDKTNKNEDKSNESGRCTAKFQSENSDVKSDRYEQLTVKSKDLDIQETRASSNISPDSDEMAVSQSSELSDTNSQELISLDDTTSSVGTDDIVLHGTSHCVPTTVKSQISAPSIILDEKPVCKSTRETTVIFSLSALKRKFAEHTAQSESEKDTMQCPKFRAKIAPDQNNSAEKELNQSISKTDFKQMEILGQFNHGFIISRLRSDLFIIDQHATDEKYNFEMLQKHTVMKRQALLVPKPLGLSSANELLLMDNLEAFHRNGFEFAVDEDAQPTKRVSLKTQPVSKNWQFGRDDIDEILYMLREAPGQSFRPSRVRSMFASRACRKSVMIGKPLAIPDMRKLVLHMSEIDQPWNCPHGRPTMRHLVNLDLITL